MNKSKTTTKTGTGHHEHHQHETPGAGGHSTGDETSKSANKKHEHGTEHSEKSKRRTNTMKNATSAILIGLAILTAIGTNLANTGASERTTASAFTATTATVGGELYYTRTATPTITNNWDTPDTMTVTAITATVNTPDESTTDENMSGTNQITRTTGGLADMLAASQTRFDTAAETLTA